MTRPLCQILSVWGLEKGQSAGNQKVEEHGASQAGHGQGLPSIAGERIVRRKTWDGTYNVRPERPTQRFTSWKGEASLGALKQPSAPRQLTAEQQHLVEEHLYLVPLVAYPFRSRPASADEVLEEANLALVEAALTFNPNHGAPFSAYARTAIRRALRTWRARNSRLALLRR